MTIIAESRSLQQASIAELMDAMRNGMTIEHAVAAHLEHIVACNQQGPLVNAVLELNPDALSVARALDDRRDRIDDLPALHGIPFLVKDNISSGDRVNTTAGSHLFLGAKPARDAAAVERLKAAGGILLGKTVMTELAIGSAPAGRGGLTRNPYASDRGIVGTSTGSAAAVACGFAAFALGTDTRGSVRYPAADCSVVGLRPTRGLISLQGVLSTECTFDTVGLLTRSVADLAAVLPVICEPVPAFDRSRLRHTRDATVKGSRLGVLRGVSRQGTTQWFELQAEVADAFGSALRTLKGLGASLIDDLSVEEIEYASGRARFLLECRDFAWVDDYLQALDDSALLRSLDELAWYVEHSRYPTGVDLAPLLRARAARDWKREASSFDEFQRLCAAARQTIVGRQQQAILALLAEHQLDALIVPTKFCEAAPLWLLETLDPRKIGCANLASHGDVPELTVPAGYSRSGLPIGLSFLGAPWTEPRLVELTLAFETAARCRRPPDLSQPPRSIRRWMDDPADPDIFRPFQVPVDSHA